MIKWVRGMLMALTAGCWFAPVVPDIGRWFVPLLSAIGP